MPTSISRTRCSKSSARPEPEPIQGRILGIDPGLSATGFGIIDPDGVIVAQGVITTSPQDTIATRLLVLNQTISRIIHRYQPVCCAIETLFFKGGGARSVILSAQSRGAILTALAKNRIPVYELTPATIKLAVTGSGRASKSQLNYMIRKLLRTNGRLPEHAADALAVAWCLKSRLGR
ncbi:MAG: crossover junction endodeoxyribonuclease RuvC [candidate division WOR-3 bacterium]|uniref:Crossover junction endodeoxyribonuclease RuvC n=1 Tax=candidate division WOR-3 bacterium TaxID=2052148 RepID=A0A7C3IP17_UNCW3|nr:crossover junction endodeoxyribonuclease RuvC [candidate division WOR-3 bacterium]